MTNFNFLNENEFLWNVFYTCKQDNETFKDFIIRNDKLHSAFLNDNIYYACLLAAKTLNLSNADIIENRRFYIYTNEKKGIKSKYKK